MFTENKLIEELLNHGSAKITAEVDDDFNAIVRIEGRVFDVLPLFSSLVNHLHKQVPTDALELAFALGMARGRRANDNE